ncbi:MAG: EAL domain-containing protein [Gammaproteobacteria bacterium]|nr:EAL domain-containing protein [Gammaproteobacteria bacterium]MBI5618704.1 EAL domain-containing protein [Gammaproteobacteria bacterium]
MSPPPLDAVPASAFYSAATHDERVRAEQIELLFDQAAIGLVTNFGIGVLLLFLLDGEVPGGVLAGWFGVLSLTGVARAAAVVYYRRHGPARAGRALKLYTLATASTGLVWGASHFLFASISQTTAAFLMFVLAGLTAGGITTLSAVMRVYLAFLATFITPVIVHCMLLGGSAHETMALMIALYGVALCFSARNYERNLLSSLSLARTNARLVEDLQRFNGALEISNDRLREQIDGRRLSDERFRNAFANAPVGMALCDAGMRMVRANRAICEMFGYDEQALVGRRLADLTHEDDIGLDRESAAELIAGRIDHYQIEKRYRNRRGETIWGLLSVSCFNAESSGGPALVVQIQDVTETRIMSERLSWQARHDDLTGLVNRREFEHRLQQAIVDAAQPDTQHAVCYLDLDQFKVVNDTCGHLAGDQLLRQIAGTLLPLMRRSDTIARLGGDEFGVLMQHCSGEQALRIAQTMRKTLEDLSFVWEDKRYKVGASIGLVPIVDGSVNVTDVLSAADSACFTAKERGRNRVHVYHPTDAELARRHGEMAWVERITRALDEDRFELMYQSIEAAAGPGRDGLHLEFLVRMRGSDGELVPPGAFLPAAERYHIASRLDRWVVARACSWIRGLGEGQDALALCAINVSGQSLTSEEFLAFVLDLLAREGMPAGKICFEITETAAIENLPAAQRFMAELKARGCRFALDDFGSGLSSFGYLRALPVDYLKIDGAFVKDLLADPVNLAMVSAINSIGQILGKRTIAEFVEDDATRRALAEIGVDFVQGYGIGRPRLLSSLPIPDARRLAG